MKRLSKAQSLLLVLACTTTLVLIFRSYLLAYVVQPIALLAWAAWRVVASVDEHVWWTVVVAACSLALVRLLMPRAAESRPSAYQPEMLPPSRVEHWYRLLEEAAESRDGRQRLYESLSLVQGSVMALDDWNVWNTPAEAETRSMRSPPDGSRQLLHALESAGGATKPSKLPDSWMLVPKWLRRRMMRLGPEDERLVHQTLTLMETRLDIHHDD